MSLISEFGYSTTDVPHLPEEVLAHLLGEIPRVADEARAVLGPMSAVAEQLRNRLVDAELIEEIDPNPPAATIAAVDGAWVPEPQYGGDLLVAVALAAEGLTPAGLTGQCPAFSSWCRFLVHDFDIDRLGKVAMTAQELHVLAQLPHDMCILDGSHQTPVIQLNSGLTSGSPGVRKAVVEICEQFEVPDRLREICEPSTGAKIVASPKQDSSRDLARYCEEKFAMALPATDKVLAALVLRPGEMIKAIKAPPSWGQLHIKTEEREAKEMAEALNAAIQPLRDRVVRIAYLKPHQCSTAVKIEFKEHLGADWRQKVAAVVAAETPGPFLQEPYCQHLADLWAKSAKIASSAQMDGIRLVLAQDASVDYLEYLIRGYRTGG